MIFDIDSIEEIIFFSLVHTSSEPIHMSHVDDLDSRFLLKANDALELPLLCFIAIFQRPFFSEMKGFTHGSQPASGGRPTFTAHRGNKKLNIRPSSGKKSPTKI